MTVNTTNITSGPYVGNNLNDTYSYTFRVEDKTQLSVYETDDVGVQTPLVVDTDYTVAGIGVDAGGTVVRTAGNLPTDYQWYIRSNRAETQDTAFASQGGFKPDVHEAQMDHITYLIQQSSDKLTRSFKLSDTIDIDGDFALAVAAAGRISKFLAFDAAGNITVSTGTGADSGLRADLASVLSGAVLVALQDTGGNYNAATVEAAFTELTSIATGEGASIIGVEDAAGNITAANVEGALAELALLLSITPGIAEVSKAVILNASGDFNHIGTSTYDAGEGCVFNGDSITPANTLDDYEEGTWTPNIQDTSFSDGEGQTVSSAGIYTKVGNIVSFNGVMTVTSLGTLTASSSAYISGLPFIADENSSVHFGFGSNLAIVATSSIAGFIPDGTDYIDLTEWSAASGTGNIIISEITAAGVLYFSGHYRV